MFLGHGRVILLAASWVCLVKYLVVLHLAVLSIVQSNVVALRIAIEKKRAASKQSSYGIILDRTSPASNPSRSSRITAQVVC